MAHFAKLDENGVVLEVHVVNNDALDSDNEEASGIAFLTEWSGGYDRWVQCSYNASFRKNYPGPGFIYDVERNAFIPPNPQSEYFRFDETTCKWVLRDEFTEIVGNQ